MISERLRAAREMCGMTIRQSVRFSEERITVEAIQSLENGTRGPSQEEVSILAETYDVRPEWLENGSDNNSTTLIVNARGLDGLAPNDVAKLMLQLQAHRQP